MTILLLAMLLGGCSFPLPWNRPPAQPDLVEELMGDTGGNGPPGGRKSAAGSVKRSSPAGRADGNTAIPQRVPTSATPRSIAAAKECLASAGLPPETQQPADPSNYDRRLPVDASGQQVPSAPMIIVLHETVVSEADTLRMFQNNHADAQQASYHMLIARDGRRLRVVPDSERAFGAGDSAFGNFTVQLKPDTPGSINNVALHLSLVSPPDGRSDAESHSGYTQAQYRNAAAQVLLWQHLYGIRSDYITTHHNIDRSGTRRDPRSFHWDLFSAYHQQLTNQCYPTQLAESALDWLGGNQLLVNSSHMDSDHLLYRYVTARPAKD